jgi:hypothetical protein
VRLVIAAGRHAPDARRAHELESTLPSRNRQPRLVVVDDPAPVACAVTALPCRGGPIVVSRGLWGALGDRALRRAVLEHERAHLRHRHGVLLALGALTVAVDPSCRGACRDRASSWNGGPTRTPPMRPAGPRAEAVATVALASSGPVGAVAFNGPTSAARINALLESPVVVTPTCRRCSSGRCSRWRRPMLACHQTELLFEALRQLH